ncbi:PPR_2 domain-containing protein [Cephalotus follicularis]|uniref:PPR_2 domain-containing protein n=1 Tax=Cephalotus follicularis TaxID=3775 RepID=A0A1Q3CDJ0_CEPFO|nr:PPR_2 domain-containing protein [Cephalotus follicularis]
MVTRAISRSKILTLVSILVQNLMKKPITHSLLQLKPQASPLHLDLYKPYCGFRHYHDGRPRGPLWRGKKLIGKEALFVILGLKRFKDDEERLQKFIKTHVIRLLKMDMVAVLTELERQEETSLAVKVFEIIRKQGWYKPDVFIYKDLIISLARCKKMDEAMRLWESMRKEELFPDDQTYTEVIRGFLRDGSPADAMNIYEDMVKSPDPPEELPFRILLKGLLPHPLLRNRVKKDFEELFPEKHAYDPPEEIFGKF